MGRNNELHAGIQESSVEAAAYHNAHGGSSFYANRDGRASYGWAVGGMKGAPETTVPRAEISPSEYQQHRDKVKKVAPDATDAIAGTWVENGKTVMDASEVFHDRRSAHQAQTERHERAVYNLHEDKAEDLRKRTGWAPADLNPDSGDSSGLGWPK